MKFLQIPFEKPKCYFIFKKSKRTLAARNFIHLQTEVGLIYDDRPVKRTRP